jgi:hypothetical protein
MDRIQNIQSLFQSRVSSLQRKQTENALLDKQIAEAEAKITEEIASLEIGQEALQFLEDVANSRRNRMKEQIETIITEAVRLVYGSEYRVELGYRVKNNRSSMDIEIVKETPYGEVRRTMEGIGGSVSDTISVPLRLLVLLGTPRTGRVCALDESYKHVDKQRIELVAEFVKDISHKLGVQVIMCSHHSAMIDKADTVYKIWDDGGKSESTKVSV